MDLASLYIILGSISFITSVVTLGVLIKKFIEQPAAHGFFVYSDTIASALLSLGLLLDGVKPTRTPRVINTVRGYHATSCS